MFSLIEMYMILMLPVLCLLGCSLIISCTEHYRSNVETDIVSHSYIDA